VSAFTHLGKFCHINAFSVTSEIIISEKLEVARHLIGRWSMWSTSTIPRSEVLEVDFNRRLPIRKHLYLRHFRFR
jgi:hypothetical protein